jgi:membrane protease YdiL (CAAX protease family)
MYFAMTVIGAMICYYAQDNLLTSFRTGRLDLVTAGMAGVLGAGVLLILNYFLEEVFPPYRRMRMIFVALFGPIGRLNLVILALASAIGEEILFRGAIQPTVGIIGASLLFGLLHLGPEGRFSVWSLWAIIAGLLLGWIYESTGTLWGPIFAHFFVNAFSMLRLRGIYRRSIAKIETHEGREDK